MIPLANFQSYGSICHIFELCWSEAVSLSSVDESYESSPTLKWNTRRFLLLPLMEKYCTVYNLCTGWPVVCLTKLLLKWFTSSWKIFQCTVNFYLKKYGNVISLQTSTMLCAPSIFQEIWRSFFYHENVLFLMNFCCSFFLSKCWKRKVRKHLIIFQSIKHGLPNRS